MYPSHLKGNVRDASVAFRAQSSETHHYYQIVCTCGGLRFRLTKSQQKTVVADCLECGRVTVVYDLQFYPAAVKLSGKEVFETIEDGVDQAGTYIMFEYSEREPDMDFDQNDITWCQIFVLRRNGVLEQVLDDETA